MDAHHPLEQIVSFFFLHASEWISMPFRFIEPGYRVSFVIFFSRSIESPMTTQIYRDSDYSSPIAAPAGHHQDNGAASVEFPRVFPGVRPCRDLYNGIGRKLWVAMRSNSCRDEDVLVVKLVWRKPTRPTELLANEARIHERVSDHPNILPLLQHQSCGPDMHAMLFPYCRKGDLKDLMDSLSPHFPTRLAQKFSRDIAGALRHCHRLGVIHRDVKPENVLISDDRAQAQLMDFGHARMDGCSTGGCGTHGFVAPEILEDCVAKQTSAVDCWGLGCCMHEMIVGNVPERNHDGSVELFEKTIVDRTDGTVLRLLRGLLDIDPLMRVTAEATVLNPWIRSGVHEDSDDLPPGDDPSFQCERNRTWDTEWRKRTTSTVSSGLSPSPAASPDAVVRFE